MLKRLTLGMLLMLPSAALAQSVSFTTGYVGIQNGRENELANGTALATADIARVVFSQQTADGLFVDNGNGVEGTLTIYGTNGKFVSVLATAEWKQKTGNVMDAVGFIPVTSINMDSISDPDLAFLVNNVLTAVPGRNGIDITNGIASGSQDRPSAADLNGLLPLQPAGVSFDPTPTLSLDLTASEAGATASFPIVLTKAPTQPVTITFDQTGECTFSPDPIVFTAQNWFDAVEVTATAVDDAVEEGTHDCTPVLSVSSTDASYNNFDVQNEPTISITDNDGAGVNFDGDQTVAQDLSAAEGGKTAVLPVALTSAPAGGATVRATLSDPTNQCEFSPATLDFTSANYGVFQSVTVTAIDDSDIESVHSCVPVVTFSVPTGTDAGYSALGSVNAPEVSIADNDVAGEPQIQGPSGDAGDEESSKIVDAGTTAVHDFSVEGVTEADGSWSIRNFDVALFQIDPETGALAFNDPAVFDEQVPENNIYQVEVVFTYDGIPYVQLVTIEVRDSALAALGRNRAEIEQIIVDAEIAKLRGQQNALRAMTSSARDRLANGACKKDEEEEQAAAATDEKEECRVDETDLTVDNGENGISVSGSNTRIVTFDGYRKITNLNLSMTDSEDMRTLSFNGHFALENFRSDNALYGIFAGVSVNQSDVNRGFDGAADSYGLSLGAYAVNKLSESIYSEAYLSIGRSQNQLDLTNGYLDVAADYGTTELNAGWILSGEFEKGDWDILPELGIQLSRSSSSSIDVTGSIPGDTASVTWEGLTASLARANLSTDFRYYVDGRADDAWILNFKPGVVCERVDAITVTSGCGTMAGLGLNRTSADGAHRFSAEATIEDVNHIRRHGASLNYELRF